MGLQIMYTKNQQYSYGENYTESRGQLVEIHLADLHFGAFNPKTQYELLMEQFFSKISLLPKIDIISIDGDLFDHKVMANSDTVMYASKFVDQLVNLCRAKNATLVILSGTYSHDFDQLKLFYHYMDNSSNLGVDVRIITTIKFEVIKGARILMIPELNDLDESIYQEFLFHSGWYDEAFVHGTFEGAVYGNITTGNSRLFTAHDFLYCTGVVISGHVHKSGCFQGFYYYCGSPYRWKFGEEEEKGFLILLHDLDTRLHYVSFNPIDSFRYITIYLDELVSEDPKKICDYINQRRIQDHIDFIKVRFRVPISGYNKTVINNYYRNNPTTFVEFLDKEEAEKKRLEDTVLNTEFSYLTDSSISDFERFVKYVNDKEGHQFITVERLTELLDFII